MAKSQRGLAPVKVNINTAKSKIEYGRQAAMVFNARERKMLLQQALEFAGQMWVAEYLPRRYVKNYMKRGPFYHDTDRLALKTKIRKARLQGQTPNGGRKKFNFDLLQPLVMTGTMRDATQDRARIKAVSTKGNIRGWIILPTGHGIQTRTRELLSMMPPREQSRIANVFAKYITDMIGASSALRTRTGRVSKTGKRTLLGARTTIRTRKLKGLK